jgi:hypothetical protein
VGKLNPNGSAEDSVGQWLACTSAPFHFRPAAHLPLGRGGYPLTAEEPTPQDMIVLPIDLCLSTVYLSFHKWGQSFTPLWALEVEHVPLCSADSIEPPRVEGTYLATRLLTQ